MPPPDVATQNSDVLAFSFEVVLNVEAFPHSPINSDVPGFFLCGFSQLHPDFDCLLRAEKVPNAYGNRTGQGRRFDARAAMWKLCQVTNFS
jgi:hypothetical protein